MAQWYRICPQCKRFWFQPWVGKIPWRRAWQHTPVFLPRKSHGQRSLVGHSPWGRKELDRTWVTKHTHANRTKLGPTPHTRQNVLLKTDHRPNWNPKSIQLLGENTRENVWPWVEFLRYNSKTWPIKEKNGNGTSLKLKTSVFQKVIKKSQNID